MLMRMNWIAALVLMLLSLPGHALISPFKGLEEKAFSAKSAAIEALASSNHPHRMAYLYALRQGQLYYQKETDRLVVATRKGQELALSDPETGMDLGLVSRRDAHKITINNRIRKRIQILEASMNLGADDPAAREAAIRALISNPDPSLLPSLQSRRQVETEAELLGLLEVAAGLTMMTSDIPEQRLAGLALTHKSLVPEVRNLVRLMANSDPSTQVQATAAKTLASIETRVAFYGLLENLFFGLSLGSVLLLAAVGLAITFGVLGVINMAHGELIMIGAYTTFFLQSQMPASPGLAFILSIPAAFIVSGGIGILIERGIIRHLYGRPLETLLATFGVSLILQQLVRVIFGPLNQTVITPAWMSGLWQINGAFALTLNRLYILGFSLLVFAALVLILRKTALGLQIRAVTQNRRMAASMGIRTGHVDALTFGLGAGVAGVAGVALSLLTNVGPNLGQQFIIDSFMVVVFGGVGNLFGTFSAAMILGIVNKFLEPAAGAIFAKILVLIFLILFIQKHPRGLFALKGRSAEEQSA